MPAPVLQSASALAESATDSLAMNAPSGVVSGDFLIAVAISENRQQANTPTGWTLIHYIESSTTNIGQTLFYRVATGGADDTPTITFPATPSQGVTGLIIRIDGQKASGPLDTSNSAASGFASTLAVPTATVAENDSLCVLVTSFINRPRTCSVDTGWNESFDAASNYTSVAAYNQSSAAGTSPGGTITWSASARILASVVIIKPAAAAAGAVNLLRGKLHGGLLLGGKL